MKIPRTVLTLSAASMVVLAAPVFAQTADSHHPSGAAVAAPGPAQPGMGGMPMMNMMGTMPMMGMMGMMRMMGPGMAGMATVDRVEGRIAFLRTELKITEAQLGAWNAFADVLRANAKKLSEVHASAIARLGPGQQQAPSLAARLDLQENWLQARLEGTRTIKAAFLKLYDTLSDDQKKTANELLGPHMGMMPMMPMMSGQMQPGLR